MDRYRPKSNVIFDDINLSHYNAFAFGCNLFDRPERDVDIVSVPGRYGDLVLDNGRYKNVVREYQVQVTGIKNIETLIQELTKKVGYFRLEDDYDIEVYFEARLAEPPEIRRFVGESASVTIRFDRKPQRYLKSGENVAITDATLIGTWKHAAGDSDDNVGTLKMVINNPYDEETRPKIIIPGSQPSYLWRVWISVLDVNLSSVDSTLLDPGAQYVSFFMQTSLNRSNNTTEIDSETNAIKHGPGYDPNNQYNSEYTACGVFPTIKPGANYLYFSFARYPYIGGGGTINWLGLKKPSVYSRWWTI